MSLVGGKFPRDVLLPTAKQFEYAQKLIEIMDERGLDCYEFEEQIDNCTDRSEMSEIIDDMKEELGFD